MFSGGGHLRRLPPAPLGRTGWPWTEETDPSIAISRADWPRVAIVTPSFNQGQFIEETIRSVLLQNYPNLQYIVIDGGSTDGTAAILDKYSPWIDYWVSEPDRGQSHAINKGLARCNGGWFNWLNSDDYLLPGALHALAREARPDRHIVAGRTRNLRGEAVGETYGTTLRAGRAEALFFLGVNQPGSLLRTDSVRAAGGVREDLHFTMDLALWLEMLIQHGQAGIASVSDTVACYRYHGASKTMSAKDPFALEEFAVLYDLCSAAEAGPDASLAELRGRCSARTPEFDLSEISAEERAGFWPAFLRRLVVDDSLLFRAVRSTYPERRLALRAFDRILSTLEPALMAQADGHSGRLVANALIHAMQIHGKLCPSYTLRALRTAPSGKVAADLLRLLLRPLRSPQWTSL